MRANTLRTLSRASWRGIFGRANAAHINYPRRAFRIRMLNDNEHTGNVQMKKLLAATSAAGLLALSSTCAQAETTINVDATAQHAPPETGYFTMGTSRTADGHSLGINNVYLTRDGRPWLPVMGEFHYTRVPHENWDEELAKMKSAGVNIVATYIIWAHHEPKAGLFDWSGDKDLHGFIEACARHGMYVFLRVGPWAHGEVRYGGTPDWVVHQTPTRRNDPLYMAYVKQYFTSIAEQTKGEYFKDGGPVIGIQLENEYNLVGPGMGVEHITALKTLVRSLGMDVPLYTVTGWDGTTYPKGEVTPVFGGYPDEPWGVGTTKNPPNEVYNFRFNGRVAGNAGAETPGVTKGTAIEDAPHTPFLGAEFAGGLPIMYRRRPLVAPDDIGAMWPVQLGSGVNLYGYYMFQGGRNPGLDLEENALLGGYNDLPILNYDFQAPLGQYGEAHPVLNTVRPFHLFANAFGDRLAPMSVHAPAVEPTSRDDLQTPRLSVRSEGDHGFLFMSNYVRQYDMKAQTDVRFSVKLPGQTLTFPSKPVTIPTGAYFIWPLNFDLDGVNLAWATAQPVTRLETAPGHIIYVFEAADGIPTEFAITASKNVSIKDAVAESARGLQILRPKPGLSAAFTLLANGKTISILVLAHDEAKRLWQGRIEGQERLVLTSDELSFREQGLELRSRGDNHLSFSVYPSLEHLPRANLPLKTAATAGMFQTFTAAAQAKDIPVTLTKMRDAGEAPEIKIGGAAGRALQPYPEAFGKSAAWSISVPTDALAGLKNAYLDIDYQGDVARLFAGADMIDDQYYFGPTWTVGLKGFQDRLKQPLMLTVMPLRKDAPIYLDDAAKAHLPQANQVAQVLSVKVVPEYALEIE